MALSIIVTIGIFIYTNKKNDKEKKENIEKSAIEKDIEKQELQENQRIHEQPFFDLINIKFSQKTSDLTNVELVFINKGCNSAYKVSVEDNFEPKNMNNEEIEFRLNDMVDKPLIRVNEEYKLKFVIKKNNKLGFLITITLLFEDVSRRKYKQSYDIVFNNGYNSYTLLHPDQPKLLKTID